MILFVLLKVSFQYFNSLLLGRMSIVYFLTVVGDQCLGFYGNSSLEDTVFKKSSF